MIDFGAEEVFVDEDGILIYAPFESFGAIQKNWKAEVLKSYLQDLNAFHK